MTVFNFHAVKIVTTGDGSAVLTNDAAFHERLVSLRNHGITRAEDKLDRASDGPWYYHMSELGFNYRMTDVQTDLGLSQLGRLDGFFARRRALVQRYHQMLGGMPLRLPIVAPVIDSVWHLFVVRLTLPRIRRNRLQVVERRRRAGIGVNVYYIPVHLHPSYRRLGFAPGVLPHAQQYYREGISLPMYHGLGDEAQDRVVAELRSAIK